MKKSLVAVRKVDNDPVQAVREVLGSFDDAKSKLSRSNTVFIKINAVWHHQHLFTSLPVIAAAVAVIREHGGGKKIFLMDNCSQGNFTRHCFAATSMPGRPGRWG